MIRKLVRSHILLALSVAAVSSASAQTVELMPFLGWRFGGTFDNVNLPAGSGVNDLDVANSLNYGLLADVAVFPQLQIELRFDRQDSRLKRDDPQFDGEITVLDDTKIDYYHVGALFFLRRPQPNKPQPFVVISGGLTNFIVSSAENATRFSFGAAFGGKWLFSPRFGARLQSRLTITYFPDTSGLFCSPTNQCYQIPANTYLPQIDVSGGVFIAF